MASGGWRVVRCGQSGWKSNFKKKAAIHGERKTFLARAKK
jgi:hypothetical protein